MNIQNPSMTVKLEQARSLSTALSCNGVEGEIKLLLNSAISDANNGAKFASMDLKNIFLHTEMEKPEYMKVPYKYFPTDIQTQYNLNDIVKINAFIYKYKKECMA